MKRYLLLRDNKQTGPHSLEDILGLGLKPYDLIWVDGKSAAWRYPAEFPEFKDIMPAAPEQPFDRFFRRPGTDVTPQPEAERNGFGNQDGDGAEVPTLSRFMQEQEQERQKEQDRVRFEFPEHEVKATDEIPPVPETPETTSPRYVSVSLPAQDEDKPVVVIGSQPVGVNAKTAAIVEPVKSTEQVEHKVLNPVSMMFPERDPSKQPVARPQKDSHPWLQYAAISVGMLSLMGLGVLIGMKWSKGGPPDTVASKPSLQSNRPAPSTSNPSTPVLAASLVTDSSSLLKPVPAEQKLVKKARKDSNQVTPTLPTAVVNSNVTREVDPALLQEEQRKRREAEEKGNARANITQMVDLQAGEYKVGVFGGIGDVDMTVSNRSGYPLDQVVVEVDYLLSSKKVFKTETLRFIDLSPHGNKTLSLPHTSRGVKLESRIVRIESRDLDLAWSR